MKTHFFLPAILAALAFSPAYAQTPHEPAASAPAITEPDADHKAQFMKFIPIMSLNSMSEIPDAPNIREVERSPDGTVMLCNRSPTPSSPTGFQTQCLGTGFARMNNAPESPPLQNPLQWILTTNTSGKPLLFIIASALSGDLAHTKIELKSQTQTLSFTRFPCPSATKKCVFAALDESGDSAYFNDIASSQSPATITIWQDENKPAKYSFSLDTNSFHDITRDMIREQHVTLMKTN